MRGQVLIQQEYPPTKDTYSSARTLFEQALKIDPNDADALTGEAWYYLDEFYYWRDPQTDYDAKILGLLDRAIALAPDNWQAYFVKSAYLTQSRPNDALAAADAGLAINPNSALLYGIRSQAEMVSSRYEQAKSDVQRAMRLSPRDPRKVVWYDYLCGAEFRQGNYDASIDACHEAVNAGYRTSSSYSKLAAALALEGKMEEAKTAVAEARRLDPNLTVKSAIAVAPRPTNPHYVEGLRKAGLPEE